jgi:hypothetical protein
MESEQPIKPEDFDDDRLAEGYDYWASHLSPQACMDHARVVSAPAVDPLHLAAALTCYSRS